MTFTNPKSNTVTNIVIQTILATCRNAVGVLELHIFFSYIHCPSIVVMCQSWTLQRQYQAKPVAVRTKFNGDKVHRIARQMRLSLQDGNSDVHVLEASPRLGLSRFVLWSSFTCCKPIPVPHPAASCCSSVTHGIGSVTDTFLSQLCSLHSGMIILAQGRQVL